MSPVSDHPVNPPDDEQKRSDDPYELRTAAVATVRVDGNELSAQILGLQLVQKIDDHHVLTLEVREVGGGGLEEFENASTVAGYLGKSLSLSVQANDLPRGAAALAFTGVVTEVQLINDVDGVSTSRIVAHSPTIALDGAKRNFMWESTSLDDALGMLLQGASMTVGGVSTGGESLANVVQYRETDYAMVMRLASAYGYFAFYDGESFYVKKADSSNAVEVSFRETLGAFTLGLGTRQGRFETSTYSRLTTEELSSDSENSSLNVALGDFSRSSVDASKRIFAQSGFIQINPPVDSATADSATKVARAHALGQMARCRGRSIVTGVRVGRCVQATHLGDLNGQYFVTEVVHSLTANGYANEFVCTPLDLANPHAFSRLDRATHLQSAVVTDNADPEELGRVKVKYCWSGGGESEWARVATFDAGPDRGAYFIPEVDDEVLIGFERGDPSQPVVLGSLFNSSSMPPADAANEANDIRMWQSRSGHKIRLTDTDGEEKIEIISGDAKYSIVMSSADEGIVIKSDDGNLKLDCRDLTIDAKGKIAMTAGSDIEIDAGGKLKLTAGADLGAKAGTNCKIEASANVSIQGGAEVKVQGAMIKLN